MDRDTLPREIIHFISWMALNYGEKERRDEMHSRLWIISIYETHSSVFSRFFTHAHDCFYTE